MIVYADILIILNLIVDYFLLLTAARFLRVKTKLWRMLLAAFEGGVFSLYIFAPELPIAADFIIRLIQCALMAFTAFGFINLRGFLKKTGIFFGITCLYAGLMTALWKIFKPNGMVINNSVVYFDISAITLIVSTVIFYFLFTLLSRIFASSSKLASRCSVKIAADNRGVEFTAILDTGNSLSDVFGESEIIICDKTVGESLFGILDVNLNPDLKSRYRMIPLTTVSGSDLLEGFRCDSAEVVAENETVKLLNPVLAISKTSFTEDYKGVVNPKIFRNVGEENASNNQKIYK